MSLQDLTDFIYLELPQRPVLIKGIDATGDPNVSLVVKVNGSPIGTYYLQDDIIPKKMQYRAGTTSTDWISMKGDSTSVAATSYHHIQSVASDTQVVIHNLNKYPNVTVIDSSMDLQEVYGDIKFLDLNRLTISFTNPFAGEAYVT